MLFGYPIEATEENWVHDSLIAIVRNLHQCSNDGTNCTWPEIIPDEYQVNYTRRRKGIFPKLEAYLEALNTLDEDQKAEVLECVDAQNNIAGLLCGESACDLLEDLPEGICAPLKNIFEYGFDMLGQKEIRDRAYQIIFEGRGENRQSRELLCPFCGDENFVTPSQESIREDLDHYLPISLFPFAGANLRNLVPMGHNCNSKLKLQANPISDGTNSRKAYDPYTHEGTKIILNNSRPCEGEGGEPDWVVDFDPEGEESETWDAIFKIKDRCKTNILKRSYTDWMGEFANFHVELGLELDDIIVGLKRYLRILPEHKISEGYFLRKATFVMLIDKCENEDEKTIRHLQHIVTHASSADHAA